MLPVEDLLSFTIYISFVLENCTLQLLINKGPNKKKQKKIDDKKSEEHFDLYIFISVNFSWKYH